MADQTTDLAPPKRPEIGATVQYNGGDAWSDLPPGEVRVLANSSSDSVWVTPVNHVIGTFDGADMDWFGLEQMIRVQFLT